MDLIGDIFMGKIIRANCQKCGFVKENISIGSGSKITDAAILQAKELMQ
jgi:hypothetical protein